MPAPRWQRTRWHPASTPVREQFVAGGGERVAGRTSYSAITPPGANSPRQTAAPAPIVAANPSTVQRRLSSYQISACLLRCTVW